MIPSLNIARYCARKEAFVPVAYRDGAYYSIGFGHNGPEVLPGASMGLDAAIKLFCDDMMARAIMVSKWLKVPLKQCQFDAIFSASYNAGTKLSAVVYFVNNNQPDLAMNLLRKFCYLNGAVNPDLLKRRDQEITIFNNGIYGDLTQFRVYSGPPTATNWHLENFPVDFLTGVFQ